MALSLESPNKVRQKVYAALGGVDRESAKQRLWWTAAREFFNQWVSQGNANLQFIPFSEAEADVAGGTVLADAPCKLYIFYVKKIATSTANTVKIFDDVTDDTTTTDQRASIILDAASQESAQIYPTGLSLAVGAVVTQHTTIEGATDGSDGGNGFIVVGAA